MGSSRAREFAEMVSEGSIDIETALRYHLQSNHFPPMDTRLVPACIEAIQAGNDGDWERRVKLPTGSTVTAGDIIEGIHLQEFLDNTEEG